MCAGIEKVERGEIGYYRLRSLLIKEYDEVNQRNQAIRAVSRAVWRH
jgi:hypothetical protein